MTGSRSGLQRDALFVECRCAHDTGVGVSRVLIFILHLISARYRFPLLSKSQPKWHKVKKQSP